MPLNGATAAQSVLLQKMLNRKSENTQNSDLFTKIMSDAIADSDNSDEYCVPDYDKFTSLLSSSISNSLLNSLLELGISSGANLMLMSLGKALSTQNSGFAPLGSPLKAKESIVSLYSSAYSGKIPTSSSVAANPAITSDIYDRDADLYRAVIEQFSVETNKRYAVNKKGKNDTYCNIFVWDVTSAMGAQIPHYYDAGTGQPLTSQDEGAREMTANGIYNWLHEFGDEYGWYEVSSEEAQGLANSGRPVVTVLYNESGHGHVQVVCPSKFGIYDEKRGVTIAQAGRTLTSYGHITDIYNASLPRVSYFAHM